MKKLLIKWFAPSPKTVAEGAASGIQKGFNGYVSRKEELVKKYAEIAAKASEISKEIAEMAMDAYIDDDEKAKIAKRIEPLVTKVYEVAGIA